VNPKPAPKIIPISRPLRSPAVPDVPYSLEAEEAVIGACLTAPSAFEECRDVLETADAFFGQRHAHIWRAMAYCRDNDQPLDLLMVCDRLKATGTLDDIGGPATLTQMIRNTPSSTHALVYARFIRRLYGRRQLIMLSDSIKALAADEGSTMDALVDEHAKMRRVLDALTDAPLAPVGVTELPAYHALVKEAMQNPKGAQGIPTGFTGLNDSLSGWQKGKLAVVGGYVEMGKTAALIAFALHAVQLGIPTVYFNVADSTSEDIMARMIGRMTGISPHAQMTGKMTPDQLSGWQAAVQRYTTYPLYIHDEVGMTVNKLKAETRSLIRQQGIRLVVIDYYQELDIRPDLDPRTGRPATWYTNEYAKLSKISQELLDLAKSQAIPVIVGAQVRKDVDRRDDKRPHRHDIADCKRIADRADVVLMVHREGYWDDLCDLPNAVELIVRKNRQRGIHNTVYARFDEDTGSILPGQARRILPSGEDIPL
jgi:replicative DNA helicase